MAPKKIIFAIVGEGDVPIFLVDLSTGQVRINSPRGLPRGSRERPRGPREPLRSPSPRRHECAPPHPPQRDASKAWLDQMVLHASLDLVDDLKWQQKEPYLRTVDRFNDTPVAAYVTPGGVTMLVMHDLRGGEDALRPFFAEVHEVYLKQCLSPFHRRDTAITSPAFRDKVMAAARKHLL